MPPGRAGEDLELAELSDGTSSDDALPQAKLRKHVDSVMDAGGHSFLELNTIDNKSQLRYDSSLRSFLVFAEEKSLVLTTGTE